MIATGGHGACRLQDVTVEKMKASRTAILVGVAVLLTLLPGVAVHADDGLGPSDRLKVKKAKVLSRLRGISGDEPLSEEEKSIIDINCGDGQDAFVMTEERKTRVRRTRNKVNVKVGDIIVVCE